MIGTASLTFDQASEQVEGMVQQGTAFARMEEVIDDARLSDQHKAALGLLAWSLREPALQRREARLMAGAFSTHDENQPPRQESRQESLSRTAESRQESLSPTAGRRRERPQRHRR